MHGVKFALFQRKTGKEGSEPTYLIEAVMGLKIVITDSYVSFRSSHFSSLHSSRENWKLQRVAGTPSEKQVFLSAD
jgi:hypothetical protein